MYPMSTQLMRAPAVYYNWHILYQAAGSQGVKLVRLMGLVDLYPSRRLSSGIFRGPMPHPLRL